jgi:hypothetical protein
MVLSVSGGDRISYTYDVIDEETGSVIDNNIKETFFVVDESLRSHINAIRDYIREHKFSE